MPQVRPTQFLHVRRSPVAFPVGLTMKVSSVCFIWEVSGNKETFFPIESVGFALYSVRSGYSFLSFDTTCS